MAHSFTVPTAVAAKEDPAPWRTSTFQSGFAKLATQSRVLEEIPLTIQAANKTTLPQTMSTFVTTIIGVGILGFPATFAKGGWIWSPAILLLSSWSVTHIGFLLETSMSMVEQRMQNGEEYPFGDAIAQYEDLAEAAMGRAGKIMASIMVNGYMLLVGGAFVILIGSSLSTLTAWDQNILIFGIGAVFLPLSLVDNMSIIANLSVIGVLASVVYAISIGAAGIEAAQWDPSVHPVEYTIWLPVENLTNLGAVVAVMLLGFTYQIVAPTVRADMQEPSQMPQAVSYAIGICTLVYGSAGVLAYWGFGNAVAGNVTNSMKYPGTGKEMMAGLFLAGAVVANLSVTFPILLNCVNRATETAMFGGYNPLVRLGNVTLALLIGYFLPYFFEFLTLIGALVGAPVCIFIPLMIFWALERKQESLDSQGRKLLVLKHFVIGALGLVAFSFGTYDAVMGLRGALCGDGIRWGLLNCPPPPSVSLS